MRSPCKRTGTGALLMGGLLLFMIPAASNAMIVTWTVKKPHREAYMLAIRPVYTANKRIDETAMKRKGIDFVREYWAGRRSRLFGATGYRPAKIQLPGRGNRPTVFNVDLYDAGCGTAVTVVNAHGKKVKLSPAIRRAVRKDVLLRKKMGKLRSDPKHPLTKFGFDRYTPWWHFVGQGPTERLAGFLFKNGISYYVYEPGDPANREPGF